MKLLALVAAVLLLVGTGGLDHHPPAAASADEVAPAALVRTYGVKINVDDMEKALAFYGGKLGFEIEDRGGYPERVLLKSGDREKLILNRVRRLEARGPADTQLSFTLQVNDLDQAIARMKALGVEFGEEGPRKEAVGNAIYVRDPFGRRISLMHETVVKVEPFQEPRLYNFGFLVPDMQTGRAFYSAKLGFVVRSEKYLPLDLPLGHPDKTFAFMLHYRPGVRPVKSAYPRAAPFNTLVLATPNLPAAVKELTAHGVKFLTTHPQPGALGSYVVFADPFGNVSELLEVTQ
ncbi:MAG TPA: VOC family protein [Pyrinomonadaceae bacterium]|jgi:catechol 2,3-dioxygenase